MAGKQTLSILDVTSESSRFSIETVTINAGNIAAQTTLMDALQVATQNIILGQVYQDARLLSVASIAGAVASPFAQRELKWLVRALVTANQEIHTFEVACPDLNKLSPGTDFADLTDADIAAFVTAFEAVYRQDGVNAAEVQSIQMVGRNL
jgi:hypothetical protein